MEGIALTSRAFEQGISWFPYVLAIAVFLFAYSTTITFAYISSSCVTFLFGENKWIDMGYKILYCSLAIVGASVNLSSAVDFTDASFLSLAIPNILGLFILAPLVKKDLKAYLADLKT
jgi:AGCS family alanine or glycine:cation symporter